MLLDPCPTCGVPVGLDHIKHHGTYLCGEQPPVKETHVEAAIDTGRHVVVLRCREGLALPRDVTVPWAPWLQITAALLGVIAGQAAAAKGQTMKVEAEGKGNGGKE